MPISSSAASLERKKVFQARSHLSTTSIDYEKHSSDKNLLNIEPALPTKTSKKLYKRSNSTLDSSLTKSNNDGLCTSVVLQPLPDGTVHLFRTSQEKEKNPDRICLDRRGLTVLPILKDETNLRLLSLQHNLVNHLEGLRNQGFPFLVFLDIYDNQLERIHCLDKLENLRVLLMGKNRIKQIEGLDNLTKIEVLDLHGNQIVHISGLTTLNQLKVLNLAGNQIRNVGVSDLKGLTSLQEFNLRRNRLKKLLGFGETSNLQKLFLSNNELQAVEDMCSIANAINIREIAVDNNPISLGGDCVSFLVSYLPHLTILNNMQITDQVRKAAMAWRRNKECSNATFMDLTSDVSLTVRREEVISNARTNWELLRSQTKCLSAKTSSAINISKNLKPDYDFILTSLSKSDNKDNIRPKIHKVPILPDKKLKLLRTSSQDTENSENTLSSNASGSDLFRLPPILVPIINKMDSKSDLSVAKGSNIKLSGSLSSIGPNVNSPVSSLLSNSESSDTDTDTSGSSSDSDDNKETSNQKQASSDNVGNSENQNVKENNNEELKLFNSAVNVTDTSSNASSSNTTSSRSENATNNACSLKNNRIAKSAANINKTCNSKIRNRPLTTKPKKESAYPDQSTEKDREQGGDYLIEICGRYLNIYGQSALRCIDKPWSMSKAKDVNTVHFNYANFNTITGVLHKLKHRFSNIDNFVFKETNIQYLGQLNSLAEIQGLTSLVIDDEGNPIVQKKWKNYAIYRLSHWGLKFINGKEITEIDIQMANEEYQSLSNLVLWSLPNVLLQPLLVRLQLDVGQKIPEQSAKKWLLSADSALRSVVIKEALQWKRGAVSQEDLQLRQKAKVFIGSILDETCNAVNKLQRLEEQWPAILHETVRNILLDFTQIDMYMKKKLQELNFNFHCHKS